MEAKSCLWIDLLDVTQEDRYLREPAALAAEIMALSDQTKYIIINEIQKVPRLLNVFHQLIEDTSKIFILTGSSARKLRHGGANLLAGRAFVYNLYPFTSLEDTLIGFFLEPFQHSFRKRLSLKSKVLKMSRKNNSLLFRNLLKILENAKPSVYHETNVLKNSILF